MKLYSENENYKLYHGNMLDMLEVIEPNSIDCIITDPPYELTSIKERFGKENSSPAQYGKDGSFQRLSKGFMGKEWDGSGISFNAEAWEKCYEVLKSGGYLLAFGGTRTFHRIACAIEDAGFEIRDTIMWLYGSGFPKSLNIGLAIDRRNGVDSKVIGTMNAPSLDDVGKKQKELGNGHIQSFGQISNAERLDYEIKEAQNEWNGWGTALKPSYEPIIVARKPVENSVVDNVLKYGVGGINIDECRVGELGGVKKVEVYPNSQSKTVNFGRNGKLEELNKGRFPTNTILTYDDETFKEVCGAMPKSYSKESLPNEEISNCDSVVNFNKNIHKTGYHYGDGGSVARYFYCAKASKKDREDGLDDFEEKIVNDGREKEIDNPYLRGGTLRHNIHPTVKPVELMQYLIRLVAPPNATILDCFNGSGSTGKAVMYENAERNKNYKYIGIELTDEYLPISKARIESVYKKKTQTKLF